MNFNLLRKAAMLSVLFFPAFLISSCEKFDDNTIGNQIQPDDDQFGLNKLDTFLIITKTQKADSLLTDEFSSQLVGSSNDPVFGKLDVSSYLQIRLTTENVTFPTSALAVDSVVFSIGYSGAYYGDTTQALQFKVQEIDEVFYADSNYRSNSKLAVKPEILNETPNIDYAVKPTSLVVVGRDTVAPSLRIRLKNSFGERLLNGSATDLSNNDNFTKFCKGIHLSCNQVSNSGGLVAYFYPTSVQSKLTVYYRKTDTQDTLQYAFPINGSSARFNAFQTDYSGTQIESQLNGITDGSQEFYVQSGGGVKGFISIPGITNLRNLMPFIVNKAQLVIPIIGSGEKPFQTNPRLILQARNADGTNQSIPDQLEGDAFYDGYYDSSTKSYKFTVTRHIQQILTGKREDYGLQILATGGSVTANRTILAGSNNALGKPKLIVSYTKP